MTEARCTRVGFHGFTIADAVAMRSYRDATGIPVGRFIAQARNPVVLALLRFSARERPVIKGSLGKLPFSGCVAVRPFTVWGQQAYRSRAWPPSCRSRQIITCRPGLWQ
jgi:hypothetical protein